jgi:hypothetical protein
MRNRFQLPKIVSSIEGPLEGGKCLPAAEVDSNASKSQYAGCEVSRTNFEVDEVDRWPVNFFCWFSRGMQASGSRQFRSSPGMDTKGEFDVRSLKLNLFDLIRM